MNSDQLRTLQAPLKARFKESPEEARLTLKAEGRLEPETIEVSIDRPGYRFVAGLHPKTGGTGKSACSGDMLLDSLIACAGVTLGAVATALGIEIRQGLVLAEGDLDFRGTLGVSKEAPVGFSSIRLIFELDTDAPKEKLDSLLQLTERYCVVYQTLSRGLKINSSLKSLNNR